MYVQISKLLQLRSDRTCGAAGPASDLREQREHFVLSLHQQSVYTLDIAFRCMRRYQAACTMRSCYRCSVSVFRLLLFSVTNIADFLCIVHPQNASTSDIIL